MTQTVPAAPLSSPLCLVLDSNAVFDWLLFQDPACVPFAEAIAAGEVRWIATQAMLEEADAVLDRGDMVARQPRFVALRASRQQWVHLLDEPAPPACQPVLACADPDDQKFIDLALANPPAWLVTRDKALLALERPARARRVLVLRPSDWQAAWSSRPVFPDNPPPNP